MQVFRSLQQLPPDFGQVVATIGNFDGVHRGHCWVFDRVIARARALGVHSLAITFHPHPVRVLRPEAPHSLITPLAQKLDLLAVTGLDATLVLPFDLELSRTSARDFAADILWRQIRAIEVHEGENFRLGYQATGDMHSLAELGRQFGFTVHAYAPHILRGEPVSSSRIRTLLAQGQLSQARALLGRSFSLRSTPASGRGYGSRYTVPTINLAPYSELLPANGVYVTEMRVDNGANARFFQAVTNIGNRPTFGEDSFTIESHLLDFQPLSLTEETPLELTFLHRLREERRWPTPEALREQIGRDVRNAKHFFNLHKIVATATARTSAHSSNSRATAMASPSVLAEH